MKPMKFFNSEKDQFFKNVRKCFFSVVLHGVKLTPDRYPVQKFGQHKIKGVSVFVQKIPSVLKKGFLAIIQKKL